MSKIHCKPACLNCLMAMLLFASAFVPATLPAATYLKGEYLDALYRDATTMDATAILRYHMEALGATPEEATSYTLIIIKPDGDYSELRDYMLAKEVRTYVDEILLRRVLLKTLEQRTSLQSDRFSSYLHDRTNSSFLNKAIGRMGKEGFQAPLLRPSPATLSMLESAATGRTDGVDVKLLENSIAADLDQLGGKWVDDDLLIRIAIHASITDDPVFLEKLWNLRGTSSGALTFLDIVRNVSPESTQIKHYMLGICESAWKDEMPEEVQSSLLMVLVPEFSSLLSLKEFDDFALEVIVNDPGGYYSYLPYLVAIYMNCSTSSDGKRLIIFEMDSLRESLNRFAVEGAPSP